MTKSLFKLFPLSQAIILATAGVSLSTFAQVYSSDQRLDNLTLSGSNSYATENVSSFGHSTSVLSGNSVNLGHSSTVLGASLDKKVDIAARPLKEPTKPTLDTLKSDESYTVAIAHPLSTATYSTAPYIGKNSIADEYFIKKGSTVLVQGLARLGPTVPDYESTIESPFNNMTTIEYEAKKTEIRNNFMALYNSASDVEKEYINAIVNLTDGTLKKDNLWNGDYYVFIGDETAPYDVVKEKIGIEAYSPNLASDTLREYFLTYANSNNLYRPDIEESDGGQRFIKLNEALMLYVKSFDTNAAAVAAENTKIVERNTRLQAEYDVAKAAYDQQLAAYNESINTLSRVENEIKAAGGEGYAINIGVGNLASGDYSITVGSKSKNIGKNAVSIGSNNTNAAENATLLGANIAVPKGYTDTVVLGANSMPAVANPVSSITLRGETYEFAGKTPTSTVSIGSAGKERQITNVAAGRISTTSTDAINGSQFYALVDAVNKLTLTGTGSGTPTTVTVLGEGNITVDNSVPNTATVSLNDDVNLGQSGSLTIGGVVIKGDLVNAGNNVISNVANGQLNAESKDAINGSQLYGVASNLQNQINSIQANTHWQKPIANLNYRIDNLENRVSKMDKRRKAGTASALAAAGLPQPIRQGQSGIVVAAGQYGSQSGIAVGYTRASDSGRMIIRASVTTNSQKEFGSNVGVGYFW